MHGPWGVCTYHDVGALHGWGLGIAATPTATSLNALFILAFKISKLYIINALGFI